LLIASTNAGKIREFRQLLAGMGLEIAAQPGDLEVEETGATFAENARLKAITVARHSGSWTLADDSGLSVAALNGAPGVHSARYAATDPARISRLLHELAGSSDRTARFCAALALADPNGNVRIEVEGLCAGVILEAPRGEGGVGYDPVVFVPKGFNPSDVLVYGFYSGHAKITVGKAVDKIIGTSQSGLTKAIGKLPTSKQKEIRDFTKKKLIQAGASYLKDVSEEAQSRMIDTVLDEIFDPASHENIPHRVE